MCASWGKKGWGEVEGKARRGERRANEGGRTEWVEGEGRGRAEWHEGRGGKEREST